MPRTRLIVLHLDAVPGIGAQGIAGTEYGVNASIGRPEVDIQAMPIGIVVYLPDVAPVTVARNRELETAVHHRALYGPRASAIAAGQGPGVEVATLKSITEVRRWYCCRPAEGHGLRTIGRIVGEREARTARSTCARGEGQTDRARAASCQRVAAAGTGVALRKISRVGARDRDTADAQRRRTAVGERHGLCATASSHVLIAKAHTRRAQTDQRGRYCTSPG